MYTLQAIYNRGSNAMSVDRLLELLKQFKDSTNKRERVPVHLLPSSPTTTNLLPSSPTITIHMYIPIR